MVQTPDVRVCGSARERRRLREIAGDRTRFSVNSIPVHIPSPPTYWEGDMHVLPDSSTVCARGCARDDRRLGEIMGDRSRAWQIVSPVYLPSVYPIRTPPPGQAAPAAALDTHTHTVTPVLAFSAHKAKTCCCGSRGRDADVLHHHGTVRASERAAIALRSFSNHSLGTSP